MTIAKKIGKTFRKATLVGLAALCLAAPLTVRAAEREPVSLTLAHAVEMALDNNHQIKMSAYDREQARWLRSELRRGAGLTVNWNGSVNRLGGRAYEGARKAHSIDPSLSSRYFYDYTNQGSFALPLFSGQLNNNIKAADYKFDAAELTLESTKQQIVEKTTASYYNILHSRNLVDVGKMAVDTLEEHLRNVMAQYNVGVVAKSDVLRTQVQLANARQSLVNYENSYALAVSNLNNLIGLPTDTPIDAVEELTYTKYDMSVDECTDYALTHRPDGLAALREVKAARSSMSSAKAGWQPVVQAVGNTSVGGEQFYHNDHQADSWQVGLQVSWNIFDNGVTSAKVHGAKAAMNKAEEAAAATMDNIRLEVRSAYLNMQAAEKNILTTTVAVEQAEEDYKIALARYSAGVGTNLDVMDAETALTQTRESQTNALYEYNTGKASLDRALGIRVDLDVTPYVMSKHATPYKHMRKHNKYPVMLLDETGPVRVVSGPHDVEELAARERPADSAKKQELEPAELPDLSLAEEIAANNSDNADGIGR